MVVAAHSGKLNVTVECPVICGVSDAIKIYFLRYEKNITAQ